MKQKLSNLITYVVILLLAVIIYAIGGNIEPSTPPGVSTMHTLDEIYAAASSELSDDPIPDIADIHGAKAIHMTIEGEIQGLISKGSCTFPDREDTIGVIAFEHSMIVPRDETSGQPNGPRRHSPIVITQRINKSTPLLCQALATGELLTTELTFYHKATSGDIVPYYIIELEGARVCEITHIDSQRVRVSFMYSTITWTHEIGETEGADDWRTSGG